MMHKHRIAMVGSGSMAKNHCLGLSSLPYYYADAPTLQRVAIASTSPERREEFARRYEFAEAVSPEELWLRDDIDAVILTGPNHVHFEHLAAATDMEGLRHIYLEKPVCATLREAEELAERLERWPPDKAVQIGFQFLQMGSVRQALRRLYRGDFLGPVHFFGRYLHSGYLREDYRKKRLHRLQVAPAGGATADLGSHVLSLLVAFLGGDLEIVSAVSSGQFPDVPKGSDLCTTALIRDNLSKATGAVTASRISAGAGDLLELEIRYQNGAFRLSTERPDILETFDVHSCSWQTHHCGNDYLPLSGFPSQQVAAGWIRSLIHGQYLFFGGSDPDVVVPGLEHGLVVQRLIQGIADRLQYEIVSSPDGPRGRHG